MYSLFLDGSSKGRSRGLEPSVFLKWWSYTSQTIVLNYSDLITLCTCLNLTQTKVTSCKSLFQKSAAVLKVCSMQSEGIPIVALWRWGIIPNKLRGWLSLPFHLDEVFQSHQVLLHHYSPFVWKPHYKQGYWSQIPSKRMVFWGCLFVLQ